MIPQINPLDNYQNKYYYNMRKLIKHKEKKEWK